MVIFLLLSLCFTLQNFEVDGRIPNLSKNEWNLQYTKISLVWLSSQSLGLEGIVVAFFLVFSLSFVRGADNQVVDYLAKNTSLFLNSVWIEEAPSEISPFFAYDVIAHGLFCFS